MCATDSPPARSGSALVAAATLKPAGACAQARFAGSSIRMSLAPSFASAWIVTCSVAVSPTEGAWSSRAATVRQLSHSSCVLLAEARRPHAGPLANW